MSTTELAVSTAEPDAFSALNELALICHQASRDAGWYTDLETGEEKVRNVPEMLMLIVSEASEAMEGYRKGLQDDKLPHRKMVEVELADMLIRIFDLGKYLKLDLSGAAREKYLYNRDRADHKIENRKLEGGKAF